MSKHPVEMQGSKARDHEHPRHHFIRHAHRDWRVWVVVMLMVAMTLVYVFSDDLRFGSGKRPRDAVPAINAP